MLQGTTLCISYVYVRKTLQLGLGTVVSSDRHNPFRLALSECSRTVFRSPSRSMASGATEGSDVVHGHCLCGKVQFDIDRAGWGATPSVHMCHCEECRRQTSSALVCVDTKADAISIRGEPLRWYQSSAHAERGFCSNCGTVLFWRFQEGAGPTNVEVSRGALDVPIAEMHVARHIFTKHGNVFPIPADTPHFTTYPGDPEAETS
jgi:hypothetical protein